MDENVKIALHKHHEASLQLKRAKVKYQVTLKEEEMQKSFLRSEELKWKASISRSRQYLL